MNRRSIVIALLLVAMMFASLPIAAQQPVVPAKDANDPIERIKDEGINRSQVMQTLSYLSDVIGPRLTGSPNLKRANEWTRDKLTSWGVENAHLEAWGPFGRGWILKEFSAEATAPQTIPLIAYPKAWSPDVKITNGDVVYVDAKDETDLQRFKGQLRNKIVLTAPMRDVEARIDPMATRLSATDLVELADAPEPGKGGRPSRFSPANPRFQTFIKNAMFSRKRQQLFLDEGVALAIDPSDGDGGTIFVQGATVPEQLDMSSPLAMVRSLFLGRLHAYDKNPPKMVPQIVLAIEHYNRLARIIQAGERVRLNVNIEATFVDNDLMAYNTVGEIPGTDKKDELVMVGGHMDSWHAGTGATDNAAGVAVAMEALRILKALKLQPRRTIRVALWSGEEQGLLGSRAYVEQHFGKADEPEDARFARMISNSGPPPKVIAGPEYDKLSAYFNLDNGTGKIRGVYMQGNELVRPIFRQWLEPFRDMGASTLTISNTGGTDHVSFDSIGLPGFQFIQDEIEYETRTHHSNQDVFDRIQGDDLKQAATIMAAFLYNTAMRDEMLPRKTATK